MKNQAFRCPSLSPTGDGVALAIQNDAGDNELVLAGEDGKVKKVADQLERTGDRFAWSPKGSSWLTPPTTLQVLLHDPPGPFWTSFHPDHNRSSYPGECGCVFLVTPWFGKSPILSVESGRPLPHGPNGGPNYCERGTGAWGFFDRAAKPKKGCHFHSHGFISANLCFITPISAFRLLIWSPIARAWSCHRRFLPGQMPSTQLGAGWQPFQNNCQWRPCFLVVEIKLTGADILRYVIWIRSYTA